MSCDYPHKTIQWWLSPDHRLWSDLMGLRAVICGGSGALPWAGLQASRWRFLSWPCSNHYLLLHKRREDCSRKVHQSHSRGLHTEQGDVRLPVEENEGLGKSKISIFKFQPINLFVSMSPTRSVSLSRLCFEKGLFLSLSLSLLERVHWCVTQRKCTAQMTAFSSMPLAECSVVPSMLGSLWRSLEKTIPWKMRRIPRSAPSDASGSRLRGTESSGNMFIWERSHLESFLPGTGRRTALQGAWGWQQRALQWCSPAF